MKQKILYNYIYSLAGVVHVKRERCAMYNRWFFSHG